MTELERRDTPAWWAVAAPVLAGGTHGSTDATTTGELTLNPDYPVNNGRVTVWADTPAHAAGLGLAGTMHSKYADHDRAHAFVQENIGDYASDHKSFLVVGDGSGGVNVLLEDMAGDPAADYDYNDQVWNGLPIPPTGNPVLFEGDFPWTGSHGNATVHQRVEAESPAVYKWDYFVRNDSFHFDYNDGNGGTGVWGIGYVHFPSLSKEFVLGTYSSRGGQVSFTQQTGPGVGGVIFPVTDGEPDLGVVPGEEAEFWLKTAPQPLQSSHGYAEDIGICGSTGGGAQGPVEAEVKADITIDGDLTVGATNPQVPGSKPVVTEFSPKNDTNEDTIGGLVVMNSNGNDAPRQQVTIQKLKDAAGNPVVGGQVTLTVPGQVKLYDAATQGNAVATGTVFDQTALPKKLWVEGVAYSGQMKDVKIKVEPVGNAAGADDVSFTVLWVDVTVAFDGKVSFYNDKRYIINAVTFDAAGNRTNALGINTTKVSGETRIGWTLEGRGVVYPWDFSYPGSDLKLKREVNYKSYLERPGRPVQPPDSSNGFINDTSGPEWQDNNPSDSCGYIYDHDCPGLITSSPISPQRQGAISRMRANFKQTASITINSKATRASGSYLYYVRISFVQNGVGIANNWAVIVPPDITGDNKAFGPDQTSLNADLS